MKTSKPVEFELSLVSLYTVVKDKWKIVIGLGILAGVLATLYFIFTPVSYESTATILVSRTRSQQEFTSGEDRMVNTDAFAAALTSGDTLAKALEQFHLADPPYSYNLEDFQKAIKVWAIRNQNSVQVRVTLSNLVDNTPQLVADIANFFIQEGDSIAKDLMDEDIRRSMSLFTNEYNRSEKDLDEIREKARLVKVHAPLEEKRNLIDSLGEGQKLMCSALSKAQSDFVLKGAKLAELDRALASEKDTLRFTRSLEEEPSVMALYADRVHSATVDLFSVTTTREEVNPVYVDLKKLRDEAVADFEAARQAIEKLPEYISDFSRQIHQAELILNASQEAVLYWEDRLKTSFKSFDELSVKYELAVMSIASDRQDLLTWVRARPPLKPAGLSRPLMGVGFSILTMTILVVLILLWEVLQTTQGRGIEDVMVS